MTIQESSDRFDGLGGLTIFYRTWEPAHVRQTVVLVHGFNQHSGLYQHMANHLAQKGFKVVALDQRGFGQSEGQRSYVDRFTDYVHDLRLLIERVSGFERPILIGHSMGGLITFLYALMHPQTIKALVLSSPWFGPLNAQTPLMRAFSAIVSAVYPRYQIKLKWSGASQSTKNESITKAVRADPLISNVATARWFVDALRTHSRVLELAPTFNRPILVLQAGEDLVVSASATKALFEKLTCSCKVYKEYSGKYHEIFNDSGYEQVFDEIIDWLETQRLA